MPQSNNKNKKTQGYTLIEVLAALFIFVIVVAIISFSFMQILNNVKVIQATERRLTSIQMMLTTLQFDFSQAIEKIEENGPTRSSGSFYTRENKLHFFKTGNLNPDYRFKRSSIEEVIYYLDNHQLVKLLKEDNQQEFIKQILLDRVLSIQWYFIDTKLGSYTLWPPTRDWEYIVPMAIRLVITLEDFGTIEKIVDMAHHE